MKKIFSSPFLFPLILFLLTGFICFLNYTPNTFLTGWDTLHPEFNFSLNFQRLLNLWHSEQGLGAIPAHAQMADIPRVFILYLLHFILPLNFIRYSYIFLCFILGPLGIYFLIKFILQQKKYSNLIAFLTALFYIFNLSTVQQFYVPFEMFPTQWAFLPWILLFSFKYLHRSKKTDLVIFAIFTVFAAPQAYASQLWYAFFVIYSSFLLIFSFFQKNHFKKTLTLIIFTLLLNAFWLIPNLFYIFSSSSAPLENRDNRLYSQEYLLKNRQNGNLADSAIIKGFYFDWSAFDFSNNTFGNLMPEWQKHLNSPIVKGVGYLFFISSLTGLLISFFKKDKIFISLSPFFIIPFVLLTNQLLPFSFLFDFLIKNSTIRESFRFIFTKLSTLLLFGFVIFFSYFLDFIFQKIKSINTKIIISFVIATSLVIYSFPIFQGRLISPIVRQNIPTSYFQFWQFMNQQDNGRILTLPLNQSSGWQYYDWGYQGSGFLWFNLKQNLLDRDSDRWSNQNEQSYKEFFYNLHNQNPSEFLQSLQKYQIKYIVWDQRVISPSDKNNDQITFKYEIQDLLKKLEDQQSLKLIQQFDSLFVYQTDIPPNSITKIETINNFVNPSYQWGYFDFASTPYITTNRTTDFFPFRDLLSKNQKLDLSKIDLTQISSEKWQIKLKTQSLQVKIPPVSSIEKTIPTSIYVQPSGDKYQITFDFPLPKESLSSIKTDFSIASKSPNLYINDQHFFINLPLIQKTYLGQVNIFTKNQNYLNDQPIDFNFNDKKTVYTKNIQLDSQSLTFNQPQKFNSYNTTDSYPLDFNQLPQSFGYIIGFKSQYYSGIPLRVCFKNTYSLLCSIEDQLSKNQTSSWDYFLVPSTGNDFGYQLNISNISYGNTRSISNLENVVVIPIPFQLLSQTKTDHANLLPSKVIILNESFNRNWLAFYFDGIKPVFLKNHILANNWANAWELPNDFLRSEKLASDIHILFWPQIFEYLGLIITTTTLILVFKKIK